MDNLGDQIAWRKQLSTKYPMGGVLMEMAMGLALNNGEMELHWRPRAENPQADDRGQKRFENFDASNKVEIDLAEFKIMHSMMTMGKDLYNELDNKKLRRKQKRLRGQRSLTPETVIGPGRD
eukprot:2180525-Karenia_brevis.AAC.1